MSSSLRARALALFERIVEMGPDERQLVLVEACAGDSELRALVESMLDTDRTPHPLLDADPERLAGLVGGFDEGPGRMSEPAGVRGYRLISEIGRGGMATVYLAERQVGDVRQRVALKLVKRGIDTDEVVRRFAHETRVLASLEHPHIAHFYDAGVSEDGRPFLAMEYIEGGTLTRFCDDSRLGVDERLALFRTVCEAVQYAHQKLVVHRDIKPSNVLVTDGGEVKLLDFGIAKLLSDEPDPSEALTRTGVRVLTPEYAAPEQLRGEAVTTATDVYALGVLLYELLAGRRPRDAASGQATGPYSVSFDAPPPSTAVRRAGGDVGGGIARARSTTLERLRRTLAGDLDRIVLKAIEPDPAMRYRSAEQLLDDLDRYRAGLPVRARPLTLPYRLRKFARRHPTGIAASAIALALLAGFSQFYTTRITTERDRAQAEAERARTTTQFLQRLLSDAYPSVALGDTFSMNDLLRRATARVDSLGDQPEVQAELLRTLGDIYREQGRFEEALPLLERAVDLHRSAGGRLTLAAGRALDALGHMHYEARNYPRAVEAHRAALALYEDLLAPDDSLVLFAMNNLAAVYGDADAEEEALRLHRDVIERSSRLFTDTSELIHVTRNNMGRLLDQLGREADAEIELREALRLRRLALPPNHPSTALTLNNLATLLTDLGELEEAERLQREAYDAFVQVYGPDHHRVGLTAYNLGRLLQRLGRFEEAESFLQVTVAIDRRTYGDRHLEVALDLRRLGSIQAEMGRCDSAVGTLVESDDVFAGNEVPLHDRRRLDVRANLAGCLVTVGRAAEAETILTEGFAAATSAGVEADPVELRRTAEALAELLRTNGRDDAARRVMSAVPG